MRVILPMILLLGGVIISCFGCQSHAQVYGYRGPGLQADMYHPIEDPLFRDDNK